MAVILVALLATACTTSEAGQPSAAGGGSTGQSTPSSSGSGAPTVTIPPRPHELKLDGIEPCDLFTDAQLAQLKMERKRKRIPDSGPYKDMKDCAMTGGPPSFDTYSAMAVTIEGVDVWLTGKRNVEAKLSSVAGFAAADYWFRGAHDHQTADCTTSVDVAPGQNLTVSADNDSKQTYTLDQLCQRAEQAATMAVQTLQTLK